MGFLAKLVLTLASLVAAIGQASPAHTSATPSLSLSSSSLSEVISSASSVSSKVPIKLPTGVNDKWYVFEMMCPQWELARGCLPGGFEGWLIRGFCLVEGGMHVWSNWHNIDGCVDISPAYGFVHHYDLGNLSSHCIDCNEGVHDTYLHPATGGNVPTKLMCSCNATDTSDHWHTLPAAIMPGQFLIGLEHGQIWCEPTSYDQYPSVPDGATLAKDPSKHGKLRTTLSRRLVQDNSSPESSKPVKEATQHIASMELYRPTGSPYTESCHPDFKVTGDESGPTWPLKPRVMWAECADSDGVWANTSLDIGLCFGTDEGKLVPHQLGLFNSSCWNCVSQYDAAEPTLLCHCNNKQHPDVPGANITATTVTITPTVRVLNGTLTCFDFVGTRGDLPPPNIHHPLGTAKAVSKGQHNSSACTSLVERDETTRNQTVSVGYSKTCYYITVTKSDPVLIALCRESALIESPMLWNSLELNSCFAYRGHRIASGTGLNRDGCRDCVMDGSRLQCACSSEHNQTTQYPQFDTDKYIINDNGNLCCPGSGVCAKASASPPPALQQLQPPPEGRPGYPDGSESYYPQGGYGQSSSASA